MAVTASIKPAQLAKIMADSRAVANDNPVHLRIGPAPHRLSRIISAFACGLSAWLVIYFAAQMLRWWLA